LSKGVERRAIITFDEMDARDCGALVEPMGFESTNLMETKEFCGAARPSKELKRKGGNS
jgi:hypothetical protein